MALLLHSKIIMTIADATAYRALHDFIQYNIAGIPIVHEVNT